MDRPVKTFLVLSLAIFLSSLGNGLVVPLLPLYAYQMGASSFLIGMIFGFFSLSRMVMLPVVGRLSDKHGRKSFITFGLFIYFLSSIFYVFADTVWLLLVVRCTQGAAAAMILPVANAYAGDITPPEKEGSVMGVIQMATYGGLSSGPLLGGVVKDAYGINASFLLMGTVCLAGFAFAQVMLPPVRIEPAVQGFKKNVKYAYLMRQRRVAGLFGFELAYIMCVGSLWSFVPLIADIRFQLPSSSTGIIITLSVLVSAVMMMPMGRLADRYSKRLMMTLGGSIIAASMLFLAFVQQSWQLYAISIMVGIGGGITGPSLMALAVISGREAGGMASMMSLLAISHSLGMIAGPVLIGLVIDHFSTGAGFMTNSIIMCLAVFFSYWAVFGKTTTTRGIHNGYKV